MPGCRRYPEPVDPVEPGDPAPVAQLAEAPGLGPGQCEFDSRRAHSDLVTSIETLRHKVASATLWCMGAAESAVTQLRRGALEHCVLALLEGETRYGYDLVTELSAAGLVASEGTHMKPGDG